MTSIRSFIKKLLHKNDTIVVVSGLPRSGTSMMMSALQAGGLPLLIDGLREADASNPKGYYEYESVKKLPKGQTGWLLSAHGKAVKVISALLIHLPEDYCYRVIFMERNIDEILASQKSMIERTEKEETSPVSDEALRQSYQEHLEEVKAWLDAQNWIETLTISYNQILRQPLASFNIVNQFLDQELDVEAMAQVVDPALYREQKQGKK